MVLDQTLHIGSAVIADSIGEYYPEDPDDISVTARTAAAGETVRAPRLVTAHSADGIREADLTGHDRAHRVDRHQIRSSRIGRNPSKGSRFEYQMEAIRAGETWALDRLIAWLSPVNSRERAVDTTSRTGAAGETLAVPTFAMRASADAEREADLDMITGASVQDRWLARFAIPSAQGLAQHWTWEIETDGRAGATFALDRLVGWISDAADARPGDET